MRAHDFALLWNTCKPPEEHMHARTQDVYIPSDPATRKSRGFAFVTFEDPRDAEDAVKEMDGRELDGREVTVNIARPRPPQGGSSRGGGGGLFNQYRLELRVPKRGIRYPQRIL